MPPLKQFLSESHSVIRSSSMLFFMRAAGALIAFVTQIVIARFFGAEELGQFLLMLALANIIANIIPLGYQVMGSYFISAYRFRAERSQLQAFLHRAYKRVLFCGIASLLAGCLLIFIGNFFLSTKVLALVTFALILAPAMAIIFMNGSVLIGIKEPVIGSLPDMLFRPLTFLTVVVILAIFGQSHILGSSFWIAVVIIWLIAIGHFVLVDHNLPAFPKSLPKPDPNEIQKWRRFALPWLLIALVTEFILDLDILLLGSLLSADELAVFGVCLRLFAIFGFAVNAIYIIVLPEMFSAGIKNNETGFQQQLALANTLASMAACFCLLSAIFLGDPILNIFGEEFLIGRPVLIILMIAMIIRTVFGPAHIVLSLHDYPYAALPILLFGLSILLAGNFILVPVYGLLGAATALLLSYACWSIALWHLTRVKTGQDISLFATLIRG